jgi:hypothetical protein
VEKQIVILIAEVKYPSSDAVYLTANSYVLEKSNYKALETAWEDFRSHVETNGFRIVNSMVYVIPPKQIAETVVVK